jgi:hypothetical protein
LLLLAFSEIDADQSCHSWVYRQTGYRMWTLKSSGLLQCRLMNSSIQVQQCQACSICRRQGTNSLPNPSVAVRQQTQLLKFLVAMLTLHSSQRHRQPQGQSRIVRGASWHTTHIGPVAPIPGAPVAQAVADGPRASVGWCRAEIAFRRSSRNCSSRRSSSSSASFRRSGLNARELMKTLARSNPTLRLY